MRNNCTKWGINCFKNRFKGIITYANDTFAEISGYEVDELIGKAHNIVRHPDMPKSIFEQLWNDIQTKGSWSGVVKTLEKTKAFIGFMLKYQVCLKWCLVEYKSIEHQFHFKIK